MALMGHKSLRPGDDRKMRSLVEQWRVADTEVRYCER